MLLVTLGFALLTFASGVRLPLDAYNTTIKKREDTKYVFMHHHRRYPYTGADWAADITAIAARGVDAIALNYGADSWQLSQIASAYDAAASLKSPLKLFLSPDFTAHPCDLSSTIAEIKRFAGHPSQFMVNGKAMVSSFQGGCLGLGGWETLKTETGAYLMPFISGLEGQFAQWGVLDSWFCWGCAWPNGDVDKTTADDQYYISQLGTRYGTTVSPWLFTHYDDKNFLQKSDDWLFLARWEQLMAMRDTVTFVEMISWNDYGESHYMGPFRGAEPSGTSWTSGFPHTAWYDLSAYYIHAFKTGSYPAITEDVVYYWARPHPFAANAQNDPLGKPQGWDWVSDTLWAAAFLTSPGSVTLTVGSSSQTFTNVPQGVTRLSIPLSPGDISVSVVRAGRIVVSGNADGYAYELASEMYNFNAWVGAAKGGAQPPNTPPPTSSSSTSTTPTSGTTTTKTTDTATATTTKTTDTATATTTKTTDTATATTSKTTDTATATTSKTTDTATATTSKTTIAPTPSPIADTAPTGWTFLGCYPDNLFRLLPFFAGSSSTMTPSYCANLCAARGLVLAGTEFGRECFCGLIASTRTEKVDDGQCNIPCSGDETKTCGAAWLAEIYVRKGALTLESGILLGLSV